MLDTNAASYEADVGQDKYKHHIIMMIKIRSEPNAALEHASPVKANIKENFLI